MSKRGRPPLTVPTVKWTVQIPVDLAGSADLLVVDPATGRTRHGARSALIEMLLRQYLTTLRKEPE